jgi:uncharacterized membrane protein
MNIKPLLTAGTLLGIGLGGFLDGILFHQVLQLHSMLSARMPQDTVVNIKTSMVWDGLFHTLTWVTTAIGLSVLWNAAKASDCPWSGRSFWGALFLGWGIFNLVEGIIDHHILQIHHVVERLGLSMYDYMFLASGVIFILLGLFLIRTGNAIGLKSNISPIK